MHVERFFEEVVQGVAPPGRDHEHAIMASKLEPNQVSTRVFPAASIDKAALVDLTEDPLANAVS
jgi:hypothetical protein